MKTMVIEVLLATAVLVTLLSVVGMAVMRDPYQRLHYIAPPASLSAALITLAIFLQRGFKPESFKALFATFVLIGMNSVVTHAAARAFRIAEVDNWHPDKNEEVPIKPSDKVIPEKNP
jgi:multicomponent Na+:H+ antiporter subunit G